MCLMRMLLGKVDKVVARLKFAYNFNQTVGNALKLVAVMDGSKKLFKIKMQKMLGNLLRSENKYDFEALYHFL